MFRKIKIILIMWFILIYVGLLSARLYIWPSYREVSLSSGEKKESRFTLHNKSTKPIEVIITVKEGRRNKKYNKNIKVTDWLQMDKKYRKIILKENEKKDILYLLKAPDNFESSLAAKVSFVQRGSMIASAMTLSVYIIAKGNSIIAGEIKDIKFDDKTEKFNISLTNSGNIHIRPSGMLEIYKEDKIIKSVKIKKSLPIDENMMGNIPVAFNADKLKDGTYKVKAIISLGYGDTYKLEKDVIISVKNKKILMKNE